MNQTVTLYSKSSYNRYGREQVGSGTDYKCRAEEVSKARLTPTGEQVMINLILYMDSTVSVSIDDRATYNSEEYKVFSVKKPIDGSGNTHHLKLELIKWQET